MAAISELASDMIDNYLEDKVKKLESELEIKNSQNNSLLDRN